MPVKRTQVPDIPSYRGEDRELQSILDRVRTAISHLTKTDFVTEQDIHCKSLYIDADSFYIGGVKMKKPIDSETGKVLAYNRDTRALEWKDDISETVTGVPNTEQTQDIVGEMTTGNTETGITVTYRDTDGTIDFVLDSEITTFFNSTDISAAEAETLTDGSDADSLHTHGGFQTDEEVQDIVGAMTTSNTETGIAVTYQDADGTIDFVVDHDAASNFVSKEHFPIDVQAGEPTPQQAGHLWYDTDADAIDHDALTNFVSDEHLLPDNASIILANQVFG